MGTLEYIYITAVWAFVSGITIGIIMADRQKPNEPKPKDWEAKLQKRWMDGFKAGEKSMVKRMSERLKSEEIYAAMREKGE